MRHLTMTPKQLYQSSSIDPQPSDSLDKFWPFDEMMNPNPDSFVDDSEEPVVSKYFATSLKNNTDHPANESWIGSSFPPTPSDFAPSQCGTDYATHGGSASPVTITYERPSIESLNDLSSDNTAGVGDRNTPPSAESTMVVPPISARKASKTLGETREGKQSNPASDAKTNRLFIAHNASAGTVIIGPHDAKTKTCKRHHRLRSIAGDVHEVKELLKKMLNNQPEKTAEPRTDEVPGLLNQVVEELKQLNCKSNSATEVLHKKLPSPPESATKFLVDWPDSDSDQKDVSDYTAASLKQPASQPGNGYKGIGTTRRVSLGGPGVGRPIAVCHTSEQQPSENATCRLANHVPKSSLIISDVEDSDVEIPKTKVASILEKKNFEIARYRVMLVDKDCELTSKVEELSKKDLEIATKDIEITNLNSAIRRKHSMIESNTRLFGRKSEQISNLQLQIDNLQQREKQLTDELRAIKLAPSPRTLNGTVPSSSEILGLIDGDEGLRNLILHHIEFLSETERIAEAPKSQPDATAEKPGEQPGSGPELVGNDALRQIKPLFGAGHVDSNSDPKAGGAAGSSVAQSTSPFGDLKNQHTDFTFGRIAARPFADKGQSLSGSTPVNRNPDSKAGAGGLSAKATTINFPPYSSIAPGAKAKSKGAPPSRGAPPTLFNDVPTIFKDPPFFNDPWIYPFLNGARQGLGSSVTKGAGSANTNSFGGVFDASGASCAPSTSGNIGQGPSKPAHQPTFSKEFGGPFAGNPFVGYFGPTKTSAVPGAFISDVDAIKTKYPSPKLGERYDDSDTS